MSSSSSGMAVSVSESAWSWSPDPTVEREDVTPVMHGPIDDTGEEPRCPCRRIWQNCPCHGCSPAKKSNLNFMLLSASERFRRHLLAVPAGCNVCSVLRCSCDDRVWSPVRWPNERATVNALVTQFRDFVSVVLQFAIK